MDSLKDILSQRDFAEPTEVRDIKDFVKRRYDSEVNVALRGEKEIIVSASSAALIASLRLNLPELAKSIPTDKKIILRIS